MKKLEFKKEDFNFPCENDWCADSCDYCDSQPMLIAQKIFDKWYEENDLEEFSWDKVNAVVTVEKKTLKEIKEDKPLYDRLTNGKSGFEWD